MVFLHGVSGSSRTYRWLPAEVTDRRRVVRLDLRGHGPSAHAPGPFTPDGSVRMRDAVHEDALRARAEAQLAMDPEVLTGAADRSTLSATDTASPVGVPVMILAADDAMNAAFPSRHERRLAGTHPDVEVVRVAGAGHVIHDELRHRDFYVEHLTAFLTRHA